MPHYTKILMAFALIATTFGATACTRADGTISREAVGTILGGAAGAWAGSSIGSGGGNVVAVAAGTFLGSAIGREIGRGIDRTDLQYVRRAQQNAYQAPIGETIAWQNPESQNRGSITPVREGTTNRGSYCREFQQTITVGGRQEQAYGVACRQADGQWRIVNER